MPTYVYKCSCGHRFERFEEMRAVRRRAPGCPACGGKAKREVTAVRFRIKGGHDSEYDAYGPRKKGVGR